MVGVLLGHRLQRLLGARHVAGLQVAAGHAADSVGIGRIVLQHLGEDLRGGHHVAAVQRLLGLGQNRGQFSGLAAAGAGDLHQLGDEFLELAFGQCAHEAVDRAALEEGVDGGDRLDAQLLCQRLVLVDVDLDQLDGALGVLDHLLERRRELLAGPAPGGPEIDDHGTIAGGVEHVLGEIRGRTVDDVAALGGGLLLTE